MKYEGRDNCNDPCCSRYVREMLYPIEEIKYGDENEPESNLYLNITLLVMCKSPTSIDIHERAFPIVSGRSEC